MNTKLRPFHLALPTKNLKETQRFYTTVLNCTIGRQDRHWIDFNFYGHQLVFHENNDIDLQSMTNSVDQKTVTVPHFGLILTRPDWDSCAGQLQEKKVHFIMEPSIRFEKTNGEQATLFFLDNNGYAIELKAFANDEYIFKAF